MEQKNIRNFCIIAHIDHGKSTLADRLLELTHTVDSRKLVKQTLDSMELEREKGITIKLKAVRMNYTHENQLYELNLIDTPGHVDFAYEVSRSLAACEGAILVVDASQGIEAQTVSNIYKALDAGLEIIPVLNKVDLAGNIADEVAADMEHAFGFKKDDILRISAKTGQGVEELLKTVIERVPAPEGNANAPLRGLVFDTYYDDYLGVIALVRIVDGQITKAEIRNKQKLEFVATRAECSPESIGTMTPGRLELDILKTGQVGYISTALKDIKAVRVGDTVTLKANELPKPLPGYKEIKPFVFVSIFPIENDKFPDLRDALEKLALSDASLSYEPESNSALGFGFRCGFLGLLHAEIIQERLEREYDLDLISTTPTVEYKVYLTNGEMQLVKTASQYPDVTRVKEVEEPWILLSIMAPSDYTGAIITLSEERRGVMRKMEYPTEHSIIFEYELPLSELIANFFDDLKTATSGYASIEYDFLEYRKVQVVKMDILVHGESVGPLSQIVIKDGADEVGKRIIAKLKEVLPRQQYKVALQAAIGGKIIARDNLPAFRKDVLQGIYGGHRERKDKLLERQKKGKDKMKRIGKVAINQDAFRKILSR